MILSYESLLREWIKNGDAEKIISIKHNKKSQMDFFLSRDCETLLNLIKPNDTITLMALLRCFDSETTQLLETLELQPYQRELIEGLHESETTANVFFKNELTKLKLKEGSIVI